MKRIALLGGLGPESTILYYRGIIDAFSAQYVDLGCPEIFNDSVNLKRMVTKVINGLWQELAGELGRRFEVMRKAGAEIGAMASNTPHKIFDKVQEQTLLPLISIIDKNKSAHLGGVILGSMELPLIIQKNDFDLFNLNTMHIHIDAIVHECLAER